MIRRARGLSLVELMVALAIGSLLIAGAVYVYSQSRSTQRVSDTVARLQENGRFVLSILEPDIQLAGYYGFSNAPNVIQYMREGSMETLVPAAKLRQDTSDPQVPDLSHPCGKNFAVNVLVTVDGTNNNTAFPWGCDDGADTAGGIRANTDTLTIRRSSGPPIDGVGEEVVDRVQLLVSRLEPHVMYMFSDGTLPAAPVPTANQVQIRDLVVHSYYIANDSVNPDVEGLPALRVMALGANGAFDDEELMRGVEDLQVQFGYDTGSYDGDAVIDAGFDVVADGIPDAPNGIATAYVDPGAVPFGFQVVAVRVWVLMRADQPEQGFVDDRTYVMGSRTVGPMNDRFRRVLLSRTIHLRNARTL